MVLNPEKLILRTPAKINLTLEVTGRCGNGYHDLRSVLVPVSLYDTVTFERIPQGIEWNLVNASELAVEGWDLGRNEDNLIVRAAQSFQKVVPLPFGVRIQLEKHIPVGGGLGGGSADAAAVLIGLNRLAGNKLPLNELMHAGFSLGCDIPALVHGGLVCMEGMGDRVAALPVGAPPWWVVIVNPGFPVATGDIYRRYRSPLTSDDSIYRNIVCALEKKDLSQAGRSLFNALERPAFHKYPLLNMIVARMREAGAVGALLSGSGASVFGLVRDEAMGRQVLESVGGYLGCPVWGRVVRLLPDGVMVAHGPLEA